MLLLRTKNGNRPPVLSRSSSVRDSYRMGWIRVLSQNCCTRRIPASKGRAAISTGMNTHTHTREDAMSQVNRISKNNTRITTGLTPEHRQVWLHDTCIVQVNPDEIVLNTGGWYTPTTRTRMTQVSREWGLGYAVGFSQKDGYRVIYKGKEYQFDQRHEVRLPRA